jgi:NAD(P) transhydrogenase subunit alpha
MVIDMENDILQGCVITHGGEIVNETIKNLIN